MLRIWAVIVMASMSAVALGQNIRPDDINGGGARSSAGSINLSGVITAYGLGGGTAGMSQNAYNGIAVGFFPALGAIVTRNVADPAWLRVSDAGRERPVQMAAWREPESEFNHHSSINLTGWQL